MSDDLVKRLREYAQVAHMAAAWGFAGEGFVMEKAATRIEELEAKLAKAVGLLEAWINVATHCTIEEGVCCCGDDMDTHAEPMDCGHLPVDHGAYIVGSLVEKTNATLAEMKGETNE